MANERREDEVVRQDVRGGAPGDGAGRIEDTGTRDAGVWPASGPHPDKPDVKLQGMASFGQGSRGAAGYEDHGDSEVQTVPPTEPAAETGTVRPETRMRAGVGAEGSNAGEVDPGVGPSGEMLEGGGAGLGNAVGGLGEGDVPGSAGTSSD